MLNASIELGALRVQLLSESSVRIENKGPKGFEDRPSYIVLNREDYPSVDYSIVKENGVTLIKTSKYTVHIPDGACAQDTYITDARGKKLWAYADAGRTDTNVYLPSPSDELRSWYFTDSPRIIPSVHGYSYKEDVTNLQDWDFENNALDIFVFLPDGDYSRFCSDYVRVTGRSEMVNLKTLGYWDSRWYPYSAESAIKQINDYRERGFSIDVLVIDTDWRASGGEGSDGIGYDVNTELFPDMAAFLAKCKEMDVGICFNDHPEPVRNTTNGLDQAEVEYRSKKLTLILSLGINYWWYDRNWSVALNSCVPEISVYAFGMYAYHWVTSEYRESITDLNEFAKRALIMANVDGVLHGKWYYASDISAHRYSIQWTGDIGANTDALAQEIYTSVFGGAEVGLPYMSSDIGGHNQVVTNEMYARWVQYGALSTICRVHCTNERYIHQEGRMPWLYGERSEKIAHTYLDMRYRLLPLFYALARQNYETGLPIMQRVDIQYPAYVEASRNDEYLLGKYILVAPIDSAAENTEYNERSVFIPDGTWVDVWSGERFVGPATYTVRHKLETSPIFVREGALTVLAPNMISTSEKDWRESVLDVYPSSNYGAKISLYEDDTLTNAYKSGFYRTTDITMDFEGENKTLLVNIGGAQGEFTGERAFTERTWRVRLHTNPSWSAPSSITVNGKAADLTLISKSDSGLPFAFDGASPDGDVYEITFSGSVYQSYEIKVFYDTVAESLYNTSYEKNEIPFELSFDEAAGKAANFVSFDEANDIFSPLKSYDTPWRSDGERPALNSQKDFSFEINTDESTKYYVLYLGGFQSTAKVTVRDRAGNVKTVSFGNADGSFTKRVIIKKTDDSTGKLYVTYSMVASEYTKRIYDLKYDIVCYLSMYGALAGKELPERAVGDKNCL